MITIDKINEQIEFAKGYLEDKFSTDKPLGPVSITLLLDLLIELIAMDKQEDYLTWLQIAEKWIYEIGLNRNTPVNELIRCDYYQYLFSLIKEKADLNSAKKYSASYSAYIEKSYKLNHSNLDLYENVLMTLLEIKEFNKALDLCNRILGVKKSSIISIIKEFITEQSNEKQEQLTRKYSSVLKKRRDDPLEVKYLQYSFYYREMLNISSFKEISKGMVFGLNNW